MRHVHLDFEPRSKCDLKNEGLYRYAVHPSTEILCAAWCIDDGPIVSSRGDFRELISLLESPDTLIHAHNSAFERQINTHVLKAKTRIEQYRCSMLQGYMCGLPGSLDAMGKALRLETSKDLDGAKIMKRLCRPDKNGNFNAKEIELQRLEIYCMNDVACERAIEKALPPIPPEELELAFLIDRINDLGVKIDVHTATKGCYY